MGARKLSPDEIEELNRDSENNVTLQLEIESFFLFTKIVLDKVAHFINDYFGSVQGASLASHHKWSKSSETYIQSKGLIVPSGFCEIVDQLQSISEYRDKKITHLRNPRLGHGIQILADGSTQISTGHLYPNNDDEGYISPSIENVRERIVSYLALLQQLIAMNRDKSRYQQHC